MRYGVRGVIGVIVACLVLWAALHFMAKPGTKVSVLWGLVDYTKKISQHSTKKTSVDQPSDTLSVSEQTKYENPFRPASPWPDSYGAVKPGDQLSVAKSLFDPQRIKITSRWMTVTIENGPFNHVTYYHDASIDPRISHIAFFYRDKESSDFVRRSAIETFIDSPYEAKLYGQIIEWPNLAGFKVTVDEIGYVIRSNRTSASSTSDE